MLVLKRGVGEEIVLDGHIRVTVVAVKGHRVQLGVSAPATTRVLRQELLGQNGRNCSAAQPAPPQDRPRMFPQRSP